MGSSATTTYPFLDPSDDIEKVVADAYVVFEDDACAFEYPLRIAWIYGFGTDMVPNPGGFPTPTHVADVIIHDANDAVVFDSTLDDTFYTLQPWATRFNVHEWRRGFTIVRLVQYKAIGVDDVEILYPTFIAPETATLHQRTVERWLPQVTGLLVGSTLLEAQEVELVVGYNMELTVSTSVAADGARQISTIRVNAVPGAGAGFAPGCEGVGDLVYSFGGFRPNEAGYLNIDSDNCFIVAPPSTILTETSAEPYPVTYLRTASVESNTLKIDNQCAPCCDCSDFSNVFAAIDKLNDSLQVLVNRATDTRDQHAANIARWELAESCRLNAALTVSAIATCGCQISIGFTYCNLTASCIPHTFVVRFTFTTTLPPNGSGIAPGTVFQQDFTDPSFRVGSVTGTWPIKQMVFLGLNPGTSCRGKFDLSLLGCEDDSTLSMLVEVVRSGTVIASRVVNVGSMIPDC